MARKGKSVPSQDISVGNRVAKPVVAREVSVGIRVAKPVAERAPRPRPKPPAAAFDDGKCGACGSEPTPKKPLRRGRCAPCYRAWLDEKPVGVGAQCASCAERRRSILRHFELAPTFIVLCLNCGTRADLLNPVPRSIEGLKMRLLRDRRWGDRRAESVTGVRQRYGAERRDGDRRVSERNVFDATDLVIEMEADFAGDDGTVSPDGPITGIHRLAEPSDL